MTPTTYKLTIHLDPEVNLALLTARVADRVPASDRIRAGLQLWSTDDTLRKRIDHAARTHTGPALATIERRKVTVSLDLDLREKLANARISDAVPASERLRTLLELWMSDQSFRDQVDQLASQLRAGRLHQPATTGPDPTG